jgi:simple sugar transport system ATP-binding protein
LSDAPALEARGVSKRFEAVRALSEVSIDVPSGAVTCLLGDNGAGKSTLIKILSGIYPPDVGKVAVDGEPVSFRSPRDALDRGIACVYQDLAMIPLLPVARNFFLGREPTRGRGPLRRVDWKEAARATQRELEKVGIRLRNPKQAVGTLSGGERQSVAIARAVHFGAKVLILDEPTAALGVREAGLVLQLVGETRERGLAVLFITHNVAHAEAIGDRFIVLNRGREIARCKAGQVRRERLQDLMAGGPDMDALATSSLESADRTIARARRRG